MATLKGWPLLRGFIYLKITGLRSCHLSLIQGLALVQGGGTIGVFHCSGLYRRGLDNVVYVTKVNSKLPTCSYDMKDHDVIP